MDDGSDSNKTHCGATNGDDEDDEGTTTTCPDRGAVTGNHCTVTEDPQQGTGNNNPDTHSVSLPRHATKYPHGGLAVCVQTTVDDGMSTPKVTKGYSTASTLRSSRFDDRNESKANSKCHNIQEPQQHRKYQVGGSLFGSSSPENLAELQVRRYKYPLTGNYYLDPQEEASMASILIFDYAKRFCKLRYLRWPLIFVVSVLVFFGLITYSIWLHDISVARTRYMQQRKHHHHQHHLDDDDEKFKSIVVGNGRGTIETTTVTMMPTTMQGNHIPKESILMRALSSRMHYQAKDQQLTTLKYAESKGRPNEGWDKHPNFQMEETPTTLASDAAALIPIQLNINHQISLGIPAIKDADADHMLTLVNAPLPSDVSATATSSFAAKVSPTIPPIIPNKSTTPMTSMNPKSTSLDNRCFSTSLSMCQGVLDYDLTYYNNVSIPPIGPNDIKDYQDLIQSNCSLRAVEFICAALEPECRPSHIGILSPCRRICKAIMEACSEIIANSDTLTAIFDCNAYPDSNEPHRCEDPTKRKGYCYDNEFGCSDRSCIPLQWQCDNLKDCSDGEDEENCLICDQAEDFRCRSNEKCIPESERCDMKYDCFDGSDEESCSSNDYMDDGTFRFDKDEMNAFPRVFSYASILSPNQTHNNGSLFSYITESADDQNVMAANRVGGVLKEEVANSVPIDNPKGFANFRDSKEIMLTSDSENNFKFSSARDISSGASTTPLQAAASDIVSASTELPKDKASSSFAACEAHELRCVSGKCITVDHLCDKKIDCPDGFDELMCIYKDRSTTTVRNRGTTILPNSFHPPSVNNTTRSDKRTLRTTIKRKIKP